MPFNRLDIKIMLALAIPLILTGLVQSSVGFTSSIFLAHLGPKELGIGSEVSWSFATLMIIIWSVTSAISIVVPRKDGANDNAGIANTLRDGLWLAVILVIPATILVWSIGPILLFFGQPKSLVMQVIPYTHVLAWGVLPDLIGLALLQFIIGLRHMRTNLLFICAYVCLNIFLNEIFAFGKLGLPKLSMTGIGWGTTISYWLTTLAIIIYVLSSSVYKPYTGALKTKMNPKAIWQLFCIGLPMGVMLFLEVGFFLVLAVMMGRLGTQQLIANQFTLQFVGFFVAISFSVAQAITVRMGNELGAKRPTSANNAAYAGMAIALSLTLVVAILECFAPHLLIALDFNQATISPQVQHFALKFLSIAALFQIIESIRISYFGALRALQDTQIPMLASFIAFWCIAIPLGYYLAVPLKIGAVGFWIALAGSALVNVTILILRYRYRYRAIQR